MLLIAENTRDFPEIAKLILNVAQAYDVLIYIYNQGCGAGKYMNGRECTDCGVGTFQDESFHTDTMCVNCSGKMTF